MNDSTSASRNDLIKQISDLRRRVQQLEEQVRFVGNHPTLARGMAGEQLAVRVTQGALTAHTAPFDLMLSSGHSVEVKTSYLPVRRAGEARRWAWEKIFGQKNSKVFDLLLLIGEADPDFSRFYRDPSAPFVMFLVPQAEVMPLTTAGMSGARKIQLNTNTDAPRSTPAQMLFRRYAKTSDELAEQVGIA